MAGRSLDFDPLLSLLSYPPNKHYKLGIIEGGPPNTHKFLRYFFSLIHKWNSSSIKQLFWNMLFWNCGNIAIWITDVKIINLNIFLHCVEKHTVLHKLFHNYSRSLCNHDFFFKTKNRHFKFFFALSLWIVEHCVLFYFLIPLRDRKKDDDDSNIEESKITTRSIKNMEQMICFVWKCCAADISLLGPHFGEKNISIS